MDPVSTQPQKLTFTQLVLDWIEAEKTKGLVHIHFGIDPSQPRPESVEKFSEEVVNMLTAPVIPHAELF